MAGKHFLPHLQQTGHFILLVGGQHRMWFKVIFPLCNSHSPYRYLHDVWLHTVTDLLLLSLYVFLRTCVTVRWHRFLVLTSQGAFWYLHPKDHLRMWRDDDGLLLQLFRYSLVRWQRYPVCARHLEPLYTSLARLNCWSWALGLRAFCPAGREPFDSYLTSSTSARMFFCCILFCEIVKWRSFVIEFLSGQGFFSAPYCSVCVTCIWNGISRQLNQLLGLAAS